MHYPSDDELLDLVDIHDKVIGQTTRIAAYSLGLSNFRVIDAFIKNNEGKLFIPRRHPDKKLFPLALDCSVGGHVTSGDTYEETLWKEAGEELNLELESMHYRKLGTMTPHEDGTCNFIAVYEIPSNETPVYNPDDFVEHFWLYPEELLQKITVGGDTGKGNLPKILKKFYLS
jgi:isopentenyldiphosphate isomerase